MLNDTTILGISGILGTLVASSVGVFVTWINKRFEDKKHRRELIVNTAIENWKANSELVKEFAKASGKSAALYPLDDFIVHWSKLADVLLEKKIDSKKLEETLKENEELTKILDKYRK